jgi:hypothetical protein
VDAITNKKYDSTVTPTTKTGNFHNQDDANVTACAAIVANILSEKENHILKHVPIDSSAPTVAAAAANTDQDLAFILSSYADVLNKFQAITWLSSITTDIQQRIQECQTLYPNLVVDNKNSNHNECSIQTMNQTTAKVLETMHFLQSVLNLGGAWFIDFFIKANGIEMLRTYLCFEMNEKNNDDDTRLLPPKKKKRRKSDLTRNLPPCDILTVAWSLLQTVCRRNDISVWEVVGSGAIKGLVQSFAACGNVTTNSIQAGGHLGQPQHQQPHAQNNLHASFFSSISNILSPSEAVRQRFMYEWIEEILELLLWDDIGRDRLTQQEAQQGLDFLYWIFKSCPNGKKAVQRLLPGAFRELLKDLAWDFPNTVFDYYLSEFLRPVEWVSFCVHRTDE